MGRSDISEPMILTSGISKSFGNVYAVDGLSFEVRKGEVFGLLGPNGAGKTTTIKLILGLLEKDAGEISVLGRDPTKDAVKIKRRIGYVSEDPLIYKSLTPRELYNFIASIRRLNGEQVSKRLKEYLVSLDCLEYYDRLITTLSHGNKQKVQIIAAFLHDPEILIMDEPVTGLDAKSMKVVKEMMELHTKRGGAILFSTHIMEVAQELCDRIGIINKGRMVAMGTMEELRHQADRAGASLEDVFLKLTDADESVNQIIENLRKSMR